MMVPLNNSEATDFLDAPLGDKTFRINISRNTLLAFLFSVLLHGLILFFVVPTLQQKPIPQATTIQVTLAPKAVSPEPILPEPALPTVVPEIEPKTKLITKKPAENPSKKPAKPLPQDFSVPEIMAAQKPDASLPKPDKKPPEKPTQQPSDAPVDMMALVNRNRAKREAENTEATRENAQAAAADQPLSEEAKRDARIAENLKGNTNGIFEIKRLESRSASFSFKGWTDYSNVKLKFYEVEVGLGQDIKLAVIRRMIAIIREHYQTDFPWESHRLGRTITKSARLEDSAELESFLLQEFFDQNGKDF